MHGMSDLHRRRKSLQARNSEMDRGGILKLTGDVISSQLVFKIIPVSTFTTSAGSSLYEFFWFITSSSVLSSSEESWGPVDAKPLRGAMCKKLLPRWFIFSRRDSRQFNLL